jgi:AcrR family transcriptional regulator
MSDFDSSRTQPPARWQRHRERTKVAIEDASLRLFAEQGFDETTVEELATASGVARRTVFRYFSSKNDVIFGIIEQQLIELRRQLTMADKDCSPFDVVHMALRAINDFSPAEYGSIRTRLRLLMTVPTLKAHTSWRYAEWEDEIRGALIDRVGSEEVLYADSLARASLAVMWAAYQAWLAGPDGVALVPLIDAAFDLLRTGFVRPASH